MCEVLVLLASCTCFDIVGYPLVHVRPPVSFFGFADRFISARMTGSRMIVHQGHDAAFYLNDGWYLDFAFWSHGSDNKPFGVEQFYPFVTIHPHFSLPPHVKATALMCDLHVFVVGEFLE